MNPRRIASLLRELADEFDRPVEQRPSKPRAVAAPKAQPSPDVVSKVQRRMRRLGIAS